MKLTPDPDSTIRLTYKLRQEEKTASTRFRVICSDRIKNDIAIGEHWEDGDQDREPSVWRKNGHGRDDYQDDAGSFSRTDSNSSSSSYERAQKLQLGTFH